MNPFFLDSKERLLAWRDLRQQITNEENDTNKIYKLLKWWGAAPICKFTIDVYEYNKWPTPWELLNENCFCDTSLAVMMYHTLVLSGFSSDRLKLKFIDTTVDQRMVVEIDETSIINYSYGEITPISELPEHTRVFVEYSYNDATNTFSRLD